MGDLDLKDLLPLATAVTAVTAMIGIWSLRSIAKGRMLFDQKLAREKFEFDKKLADRKRQQEIAEEILAGAYELREIIKNARFPHSFASESAERKREQNEAADLTQTRDSYYVPISRLKKSEERIVAILSKKYRAAALLGAEIEEQIDALRIKIIEIRNAAGTLIRLTEHPPERQPREDVRRYQNIIWSMAQGPDPFDVALDQIVSKIEAKCRPVLSEGPTTEQK
jgi:hypothetical protein